MTRENSPIALDWRWSSFDELSTSELYAILKLRQEVFVVEQKCVYLDCDGLDKKAWHLMGIDSTDTQYPLAAYLRVVFPGITTDYPTVGRLLTGEKERADSCSGKQSFTLTGYIRILQYNFRRSSILSHFIKASVLSQLLSHMTKTGFLILK